MLTNDQIAVLFDIGEFDRLSDKDRAEVERLVEAGYIVKKGDRYTLSAKGEQFIEERGGGLNEA